MVILGLLRHVYWAIAGVVGVRGLGVWLVLYDVVVGVVECVLNAVHVGEFGLVEMA